MKLLSTVALGLGLTCSALSALAAKVSHPKLLGPQDSALVYGLVQHAWLINGLAGEQCDSEHVSSGRVMREWQINAKIHGLDPRFGEFLCDIKSASDVGDDMGTFVLGVLTTGPTQRLKEEHRIVFKEPRSAAVAPLYRTLPALLHLHKGKTSVIPFKGEEWPHNVQFMRPSPCGKHLVFGGFRYDRSINEQATVFRVDLTTLKIERVTGWARNIYDVFLACDGTAFGQTSTRTFDVNRRVWPNCPDKNGVARWSDTYRLFVGDRVLPAAPADMHFQDLRLTNKGQALEAVRVRKDIGCEYFYDATIDGRVTKLNIKIPE